MFRRNNRGRQQRTGEGTTRPPPPIVGTEAAAREHLERNRREFKYPSTSSKIKGAGGGASNKNGDDDRNWAVFENPIEHSLLYNMLKSPSVYPRDVVIKHIQEEDFAQYLYYHFPSKSNRNNNNEQEPLVSYAQLSALLGLSAEHYAPVANEQDEIATTAQTSTTVIRDEREEDDEEVDAGLDAAARQVQQQLDVSKVLGKAVLRCVIRYANEHDLDREAEVNELLDPFARYVTRRNVHAELKAVGSLYAGYTATLVTGNILPAMAGLAVWSSTMSSREGEARNLQTMQNETNRAADVEKAGLLDEADDV